jgi:hypothetical protein
MSLLPPPEAIYPDPNVALTAVQLHAKQDGYAFKIHDKKAFRVVFACDRGGQYDSKGKNSKIHESRRRQTGSKECGCLKKVELRLDPLSGQWMLQVLQGAHNHGPSTAAAAHPVHRYPALTRDTRAKINDLSRDGLSIKSNPQHSAEPTLTHPLLLMILAILSN